MPRKTYPKINFKCPKCKKSTTLAVVYGEHNIQCPKCGHTKQENVIMPTVKEKGKSSKKVSSKATPKKKAVTKKKTTVKKTAPKKKAATKVATKKTATKKTTEKKKVATKKTATKISSTTGKPFTPDTTTPSGMMQQLLLECKHTDGVIWERVAKKHGLSDDKRNMVSWNRWFLREKHGIDCPKIGGRGE